MVTLCTTTSLTFETSAFWPQSAFMCCVWISEQTAISVCRINWLVIATETVCVYCAVRPVSLNRGHFIIFSVITNICNKKTKGPTLMELFTAAGKLKKFCFFTTRGVRCVHHWWHGTHRYDIYVLATHTHLNMGASIFFTAAMIRAFRSARSRGNGGTNTLHEMHIAQ